MRLGNSSVLLVPLASDVLWLMEGKALRVPRESLWTDIFQSIKALWLCRWLHLISTNRARAAAWNNNSQEHSGVSAQIVKLSYYLSWVCKVPADNYRQYFSDGWRWFPRGLQEAMCPDEVNSKDRWMNWFNPCQFFWGYFSSVQKLGWT